MSLDGPLAAFLREHRSDLNLRFERTRQRLPQLDGAAFLAHLSDTLGPIAEAVAHAALASFERVMSALYDLSLELAGRQLLGPGARQPLLSHGWRRLLVRAPALLAQDPHRLAGSIANAIVQLARRPAGPAEAGPGPRLHQGGLSRAEAWIERMARIAPECDTVDELLDAGQAAAWMSGMARYRRAALDRLEAMPGWLASAALGFEQTLPAESLAAVLALLREDPWLTPERALVRLQAPAALGEPTLQIVGRAGSFRGFGGEFQAPPLVTVLDGQLLATDGVGVWAVEADAFGVELIRVPGGPWPECQGPFSSTGLATWQGAKGRLESLAGSTSQAPAGRTLAVTLPTSYRIYLVAVI